MAGKGRRGGVRAGAGRPRGSGPYGEVTEALRVPLSLVPQVRTLLAARRQGDGKALPAYPAILMPAATAPQPLPLYGSRVAAGFPSPADDHLHATLDLNAYLVKHPAATFFVRVEGDSMIQAGIHAGDILVVDRALEARDGKIVVAALNGELTVKRLDLRDGRIRLLPENPDYSPIDVGEEANFLIWGVVTSVIHAL